MKRRQGIALVICGFSAFFVPRAAHADVVIDSFQDRPAGFPLVVGYMPVGGASITESPFVGERDIAIYGMTPLTTLPNGGGVTPEVSADILGNNGSSFLQYTSLASYFAGDMSLYYGTSDGPGDITVAGDPPPLHLAVDPAIDFLRLAFSSYNHASGQDMTIQALLGSGLDPNALSVSIATSVTTAGAQEIDIPLTNLPRTELDFFQLDFNAPAGTDFDLNSVTLVTSAPEPASAWLTSLAALPLLRRKATKPHVITSF